MKRILTLTFCTFLIASLNGQNFTKGEQRQLSDADIDFEIGDYARALEVYSALVEKYIDHKELNYKTGVCHLMLRRHQLAIPYLEKSRDLGEVESLYYLGQAYHLEERIAEEIKAYQKYKNSEKELNQPLELVSKLIERAQFTQIMIDDPVNVDVLNIGSPINTPYHEYVPLVWGLEDELYFTSRRPGSTGGRTDHRGDYFEDVYVSLNEHGQWQEPKQLNSAINSSTHDACVGISADGQILYVFRTSDDLLSGDLYMSEREEGDWSDLVKLGSDINSEAIETSASISSDDRVIYFSSNREGGFGGMDIYRSVKLPNGIWSKASNLGPTVNTSEDEDSPFIHADNKTLYFSSKGHQNMGGFDVFESIRDEDGLWSIPRNMGYPINSVTHDLNFVMSSDKQTGYYSSAQKGGLGGQDIYNINFKLEAQILSVVKGGVRSGDTTHIPIEAVITLLNPVSQSVQGVYKSNNNTGKFIMIVSPETRYNVIVEAEGFYTFSGEIFFDAIVGFGTQIEEFKLVPKER